MVKDLFARVISSLSPKLFFTLAYFHNRKRWPNFSNPRDLSEIMIKNVLDGKVNKNYQLADKFRVRYYVQSKGFGDSLAGLLGVYKRAEEINFDKLPQRFAIKLNFGAGFNIIVPDKSKISKEEVCKKLNGWMQTGNYSNAERHYNLIDRRIIIEEFIDDGKGGFPLDYKFLCINGKAHCVLACSGRETGHAYYSPYDLEWNRLVEYDKARTSTMIEKPANLNVMIEMAEQLSEGLGVVRIDLYSSGSKIWFGEVTLTPSGCIMQRWTQYALDRMGEIYFRTLSNS